jgi:nicotinate-nucleotide adenylyltransferase
MAKKRIGVFGGSFDPVHIGHLILADFAREAAGLDRILFIPAAISPFKPDGTSASNRQRQEMLGLAIAGNPAFAVDEIELQREGVSYTVATLEVLHERLAGDELFLLIGSDSLQQFSRWKNPARICQLATLLVGARHGSPVDLEGLRPFADAGQMKAIGESGFEFPRIEISSTELRQRVAAGKSIRYRTPRSVEAYIEHARLYQSAGATP